MKKKIISIMLTLCVVVAMFPMIAWGGQNGETTSTSGGMKDVVIDWSKTSTDTELETNLDNDRYVWYSEKGILELKNANVKGDINNKESELLSIPQNIEIVVHGTNKVKALALSTNEQELKISGDGKLEVTQGITLSGNTPKLTVEKDATLTVENIYLQASSILTANGKLELTGTTSYSASVNKIIIGENGNIDAKSYIKLHDAEANRSGVSDNGIGGNLVINGNGKLRAERYIEKNADGADEIYSPLIFESCNIEADTKYNEKSIIPEEYLGTAYDYNDKATQTPECKNNPDNIDIFVYLIDRTTKEKPEYVKLPAGNNSEQVPDSSPSHTTFYELKTEASNGSVDVAGSVVRLVSHIYARRGAELTLTPKAADGYKLTSFYVNDEKIELSADGTYKFHIYKDTSVKANFEKTQEQIIKEAGDYASSIKLIAKSKLVKRTNGKKAVKVYWYDKNGKKLYFHGYEIYRSVKKSEYGKKPIFTTKNTTYLNTAVTKGTRYYYKVRGYYEFGTVKIYSQWSTQAWRKVR